MKLFSLLLLISFFSLSCAASDEKPKIASSTSWIDTADPVMDAQVAIEKKDFRLAGLALRLLILPGISYTEKESLEKRCGVKILEGSGDVIRGDDNIARKKMIRSYAKTYNAIIKEACLKDR